MADYKLTYFNIRGLAEPIRYIFAYAQVPYEDNRIEKDAWADLKPNTPWGQLPTLEVEGKTVAQSATIARFLAKRFNLTGANDFEAARCDELVDAFGDLRGEWRKFWFEQDATKKEEGKKNFFENAVPKYMGKLDKIVESNSAGKFLVGSGITWADIVIASGLEMLEMVVEPKILDDYPNMKALKENIQSQPGIQAWREKRPETAM